MTRMPTRIAALALLACGAALAQDAPKRARMPDALLGIWQPRTAEGAANCKLFKARATMKADRDERWWPLVGSVVITSRMAHAYSDYGEGNFHAVHRVTRLGPSEWRIDGPVGMDGTPEATDPSEPSRFVLKAGVLHWFVPGTNGREVPSRYDGSGYTRCTGVPKAMRSAGE